MLKKNLILSLFFLAINTAPVWASELSGDVAYRLFLKKDKTGKLTEEANLILEQAKLANNPRLGFMENNLVSFVFFNYTPGRGALPKDVTMVGMAKLIDSKDLVHALVHKYHHKNELLATAGKRR